MMRNLTVKREKSFVASLMNVGIYIVDESSSEIKIKKMPCRKLGFVKNNSEETFSIPNEEVKIFAIIDTLSKEYCNDMIVLPAGDEDVKISGKNKFSPFKGNPFVFHKDK